MPLASSALRVAAVFAGVRKRPRILQAGEGIDDAEFRRPESRQHVGSAARSFVAPSQS